MGIKLTIDRGNTALKAALWNGDGSMLAAAKGDETLPAGDLVAKILQQASIAPDTTITAAVYCSVVDCYCYFVFLFG